MTPYFFNLYAYLCVLSVTLHVSVKSPTIKNPENYGLVGCSGVFVSPNEVLTAGHCFTGARGHQWVKLNDGKSYAVEIEKIDLIKDLALVRIPKIDEHPYIVLGRPVDITDKVYTVNSGEGYEQTYNEGIVNNLFDEDETNTLTILHTAAIFHGASGSGLFNSKGQLVGINVEVIQTLSGAVDITEVKNFLKKRN